MVSHQWWFSAPKVHSLIRDQFLFLKNMWSIKNSGHIQIIKTHSRVSAAKKAVWHTSVLFTGTTNLPFSTPLISLATGPISFMPSIYATLHIKFEENQPSSSRDSYVFLKIVPLSSHFSSSYHFTKVTLSQPKTPFSWIDFFQIWHTYKALCGLS